MLLIGIIFFALIFLTGYIAYLIDSTFGAMLIMSLLMSLLGLVIYWIYTAKNRKKQKQAKLEREKIALEKEKRQAALEEEIKQGIWQFPSMEFYRKCKEANTLVLDNEYSIAKSQSIAMELIIGVCPNIVKDSCSTYLSVENMTSFLKNGEKQHQDQEEARIEEMKKPRNARPTKEEETFISRATALEKLTGSDKREQMLRDLISDYDARITSIREGEESMQKLSSIYLDQQRKESSWSVMGGIAEGIAGPAAGVATALNTMANNANIREYNANMRQASMGFLNGAAQLSGNRSLLVEARSKLSKQCSEASKKISLSNPSAKEIWKNINISNVSVKRKESGVLAVAANIKFKNPLAVNAPENVHLVVDGALTGSVFYEDTEVGTVIFPLPLYGIPVNDASDITLDGMCSRFVAYDGDYSVKFEDTQNLWVMEL